jgi:DNA-binding NarL/FixJ family response regulator
MSAESTKIKIFIVDDHPLVREGLAAFLQTQPDMVVVGTASTVLEAAAFLTAHKVNVMIIDLTLKNESGFELLEKIKDKHPDVRSIVLTMHKSGQLMQQALGCGARGFLLKEDATNNVFQAVRAVMADGVYLSRSVDKAFAKLPEDTAHVGESLPDHLATKLSRREQEVLYYLGKGKRSLEIAEILSLSAKTVNAHRQNIKRKLQLRDFTEVTAFAARWATQKNR